MKLESLKSLFSRLTFETPDYQRGFAWEIANVEEFWDDIERIGLTTPQHFTGTLILEVDEKAHAIVVDGQQRLTTVVLLMAAFIDELKERGNDSEAKRLRQHYLGSPLRPRFRCNVNHDSWPYLALNIFQDSSFAARAHAQTSTYTRNLDAASTFFRERARNTEESVILKLLDEVQNKLLFNVLEVDPKTFDIHVAFETINNRGRDLTILELLKNRLIYITSILKLPNSESDTNDIRADLRLRVNNAWRDIYSWLGRQGLDPLDDDEFLRAHSRAYFHVASAEAKWLETLLFKDEFSSQRALEGEISPDQLLEYLSSLSLGAMVWSYVRFPRDLPAEQMKQLSRIKRTHRPLFDPLILAAYLRLLKDNPNAQSDLRRTEKIDSSLINLLIQIERFNVLVFLVSQRRSHTGTKEFHRLAHELYAGKGKMTNDTNSALNYMARYIKASICNRKTLPNGSHVFVNPEFEWYGWLDTSNFSRVIRIALKEGDGYYKMAFTYPLLFEYEESLRLAGRNDPKVDWESIANSIEHIYPQEDEYWRDLTSSIGNQRSKYKINSYLHSLGNLLLLSQSRNSQLGKMPYRTIKSESKLTSRLPKRERYKSGSFSENEVANKYVNWTKQSIEQRGEMLLKFAEIRWDFNFINEDIPDYKYLLVLENPKL